MVVVLKTLFIVSGLLLLSCDSAVVVTSEPRIMNDRPIIGILSQEQHYRLKDKYSEDNYTSYIAASYVKGVEASGARVVPILIGKNRGYYRDLLGKINGVLFPGGATWFNQSNGYADAGQHIYEIAQELNDAGDYFPVFGTCLGFELLVILASGRQEPENRVTCRAYGNFPIIFTRDYRRSKLFSRITDKVADVLEKEDATINVHQFCIVDEVSSVSRVAYALL
ncbi:unnamed protein product [Diatraea saccharalis]|uniref:folate gamma-glutamyl hydrolase n=1 Tax=Diatraea saccharalis TaxID=40085 RepID=A0A9N9RCZ1_9NEOP|nr:unnamed protein product [Diatraea saccharalis]